MEYKDLMLPKKLKKQTITFIQGIIDVFEQEKKLNSLDGLSLYMLASNLDIFLECEEQIRKNGLVVISDRGNQALSPYAVQQKQTQNTIIALLKELGLTLNSRAKMKVLDDAGEDSPLLQFLASSDDKP